MYVPLHVYSDFSLGYGSASADELAERGRELGLVALALTDIECLAGQMRFHYECKSRGLKAITGVELRKDFSTLEGLSVGKSDRLILLARNRRGYEELCKLVSLRRSTARPDSVLPMERAAALARSSSSDLFFLTDDQASAEHLLNNGLDVSALRLLLVRPGHRSSVSENALISFATSNDIRIVADPMVVMLRPEDRPLHILQMAIKLKKTVGEVNRIGESAERHMMEAERFVEVFRDLPHAVAETLSIAEQCSLDLTGQKLVFPQIGLSTISQASPLNQLRAACSEVIAKFPEEYKQRLEGEMQVIAENGFASYFLVVAEITREARRRGIAVAARGSAVSSLVAYALGITSVDPVKNGLIFERFLHQHRQEPPDIDLDFESDRRGEIQAWVGDRFGRDRVAAISAYITFQKKSAFREGLKAFGMSAKEVNQFCEMVPAEVLSRAEEDVLREKQMSDPFAAPIDLLSERYQSYVPWLMRLQGRVHHLSVHPGGTVIADREITYYTAIERAPKGVKVTQYDMRSIELAGLVKIDLLGNRCLSELQEACRLIRNGGSGDAIAQTFSLLAIPEDDERTWSAINSARTLGCFQIETPTMRSILTRMPVSKMADLVAALAIARPGPASGSAKSSFLQRVKGQKVAIPAHPALKEVLSETYGMVVYDEQIISIIATLTGMPLSEADHMREEVIKAQGEKVSLQRLKQSFMDSALQNGMEISALESVWNIVTRFASYSFNKAHACSYGILAYQAAFLKTHFVHEFACAVLNNHEGGYSLRTLLAEFQRCGVDFLAVDINKSADRCTIEDGKVRIGLNHVKFLSEPSKLVIVNERERSGLFESLADLLKRVPLNNRELSALVLAGACDALWPLRNKLYPFEHENVLKMLASRSEGASLNAYIPLGSVTVNPEDRERFDVYRRLVRVNNELKFLGLHISDHPITLLRAEANRYGCIPIANIPDHIGEAVTLVAFTSTTQRVVTASGNVMQYVTFEDEGGMVESVISPGVYARLADPIDNPGPFLVDGKVEDDAGEVRLHVTELRAFHVREKAYGS